MAFGADLTTINFYLALAVKMARERQSRVFEWPHAASPAMIAFSCTEREAAVALCAHTHWRRGLLCQKEALTHFAVCMGRATRGEPNK
jgi:hypothetical protein